jgi:hypothetical protein
MSNRYRYKFENSKFILALWWKISNSHWMHWEVNVKFCCLFGVFLVECKPYRGWSFNHVLKMFRLDIYQRRKCCKWFSTGHKFMKDTSLNRLYFKFPGNVTCVVTRETQFPATRGRYTLVIYKLVLGVKNIVWPTSSRMDRTIQKSSKGREV